MIEETGLARMLHDWFFGVEPAPEPQTPHLLRAYRKRKAVRLKSGRGRQRKGGRKNRKNT